MWFDFCYNEMDVYKKQVMPNIFMVTLFYSYVFIFIMISE